MPKVLHDRVNKIKEKNPSMPESEAWGIATKQLQGKGVLKKRGEKKSKEDDPRSVMPGKKEKAYKR